MQPPVPPERIRARPDRRRAAATLVDIFVAPARAFPTIRLDAPWLLAYLVTVLLALLAIVLSGPAIWHVETKLDPSVTTSAGHPEAQVRQAFYLAQGFEAALMPMLSAGLTAILLAVVTPRKTAIPRRLSVFFSLAMTAGLPTAVGGLLVSAVIALRSPDSFPTVASFINAVPISLAALVPFVAPFFPHWSDDQLLLLGSVDLFTIWAAVLVAFGYAAIAKVSFERAVFVSFGSTLAVVLFQSFRVGS